MILNLAYTFEKFIIACRTLNLKFTMHAIWHSIITHLCNTNYKTLPIDEPLKIRIKMVQYN